MRYCGVSIDTELHHLCTLEEVRDPEPPIRLAATFYEPGSAQRVVEALLSLGEIAVAVAAPTTAPADARSVRYCDAELRDRGVAPRAAHESAAALRHGLESMGFFDGDPDLLEGAVPEGAYRDTPAFETNPDGVFFALQGHRLPARRHPLGVERRIEELVEDHVEDEGGELWHRRIEEIEAAAAALCAHRYAVGHARWIGDPAEGVVVLPGSGPIERFSGAGVLPDVDRAPLPVRASVSR